MAELNERMPHVAAFPHALGTGLLIHTAQPIPDDLRLRLADSIDEYESVLSRFRGDSMVAAMAKAKHGGSFDFPDWALPLFELVDALAAASAGAFDPCIGEDLIRLGYGSNFTFTMQPGAFGHLGAIHGRPTWAHDIAREGTTLHTSRPVHLDFGACGKGYLVDLLGLLLRKSFSQDSSAMTTPAGTTSAGTEWSTAAASPISSFEHTDDMHDLIVSKQHVNPADHEFLIDAGGDMLINSSTPIDIALEDPADTDKAVGMAHVSSGAFCASAPSRRHWGEANGMQLHHLLNAIDGRPVNDVAATWVYVGADRSFDANSPSISYPTAFADGLATALFVTEPQWLASIAGFSCAQLLADRRMVASHDFPGTFFTAQ
ncbi:MAG: FAD:protein FMN transferase [Bifidobacterium sp.]|jgi:thiamine biosynthesis lipoprotein|nr:FAD:protein FMN transferase [Bifidobacterium sp.]